MAKKKQKKKPVDKKKQLLVMIAVVAAVFLLIVGVAVAITSAEGETGSENTTTDSTAAGETAESDTTAETEDGEMITTIANPTCYADIEIADYGTITVALDGNTAPESVNNFVALAKSGFYDGLTFHRIISGFMMQGGDPSGDGTGGSETTIKGEFRNNGVDNNLSHVRGALSMARSNDYDSASSQFFIVHEDSTFLDGDYAVFGYVTEGMDIVDKVCTEAEPVDNNGTIPAENQPVITSVTIRE